MYAQIVNGTFQFYGGEEVGLPLPTQYLEKNPSVLNIEISDINEIKAYYYDNDWHDSPKDMVTVDESKNKE